MRELTWASLPGDELFPPAAPADPHGNRAGVSKFYFRCFQNATGSSSARKAFPELRIAHQHSRACRKPVARLQGLKCIFVCLMNKNLRIKCTFSQKFDSP